MSIIRAQALPSRAAVFVMPSHVGAPGMVRMTYLGQFAIDCDDRDSIFELCFPRRRSLRKFCRFRGQIPMLESNNAMRLSANRIMSTFYSRYVPPSRPIQSLETYDRPSSKRKHDDAHQTQAGRKRVKTDKGTAVDK